MKTLSTYGLALILATATGAALAHDQHRPVRHGVYHGRHELHHRLDHKFQHRYDRHNHYPGIYYGGYYSPYAGSVLFAPGVTLGFYHTHHGGACYEDHSRDHYRDRYRDRH